MASGGSGSSSSSLFPAVDSPQRQSSKSRNKVALPKGRSLMDWIRLGQFHYIVFLCNFKFIVFHIFLNISRYFVFFSDPWAPFGQTPVVNHKTLRFACFISSVFLLVCDEYRRIGFIDSWEDVTVCR